MTSSDTGRRYDASERGLARNRRAHDRYGRTSAGLDRYRRYSGSEKGRDRYRRYNGSEKRRAVQRRYRKNRRMR